MMGAGTAAAAVGIPLRLLRVRLTHPAFVDDLIRFLERMGLSIDECEYDTIRLRPTGKGGTGDHSQVRFYLGVWQATHPGVTALLAFEDTPDVIDVADAFEAPRRPAPGA